ncbi:MAG: N-acetyl-gamma-glutamyl-phosphate reductase [Proteobacteria bacterium]|nr:N-acetyl-gamma-glutamyl-phosphate reductase [Pseudomonadota bacterium]
MKRVGLVGGRGYVGRELLGLLRAHPSLRLAYASSRELEGRPVFDTEPALCFEALSPSDVQSRDVDAVVLALPNGRSADWIAALESRDSGCVIVDLSSDQRFAAGRHAGFVYGLPERCRDKLRGAWRIANPGCYATGIQLAADPFLEVLDGPLQVFGVSGFSGAGTSPSPRNDPELLRDNLLAYHLVGHTHEREAAEQLGHEVHFTPHVASWFRGIHLTLAFRLKRPMALEVLRQRLERRYENEPLVRVQQQVPRVREIVGEHHVAVGGLAADERRAVVVAIIDNLLKGAATQALQNLNLALGLPEHQGLALPGTLCRKLDPE